mmetsp:Transcript_7367/g.6607  ORF Transcript_7367/g.6607 Transcript_7367/m.6607 type:complete len:145 (-) Transcript_7367:667-1101(-)
MFQGFHFLFQSLGVESERLEGDLLDRHDKASVDVEAIKDSPERALSDLITNLEVFDLLSGLGRLLILLVGVLIVFELLRFEVVVSVVLVEVALPDKSTLLVILILILILILFLILFLFWFLFFSLFILFLLLIVLLLLGHVLWI